MQITLIESGFQNESKAAIVTARSINSRLILLATHLSRDIFKFQRAEYDLLAGFHGKGVSPTGLTSQPNDAERPYQHAFGSSCAITTFQSIVMDGRQCLQADFPQASSVIALLRGVANGLFNSGFSLTDITGLRQPVPMTN